MLAPVLSATITISNIKVLARPFADMSGLLPGVIFRVIVVIVSFELFGIGASGRSCQGLLHFDRHWGQELRRRSVIGHQGHVDALLLVERADRDIAHVNDSGVLRYIADEAGYAGVAADNLRWDAPFVKA